MLSKLNMKEFFRFSVSQLFAVQTIQQGVLFGSVCNSILLLSFFG